MRLLTISLLLACFLGPVTPAQSRSYTPIYDPSRRALKPFHRALQRTARGIGTVRIVQYGASHTAADYFTGHMRHFFQSRFGDAGHGYIHPAKPWRGYRHHDVAVSASDGWLSERAYRKKTRRDGLYGLAGISMSSANRDDFAAVRTGEKTAFGRSVSRFTLYFLKQPGGGRFDVYIDDEHFVRVSTKSRRVTSGTRLIRVPDGPHRLEVRPVGDGEFRFFGVVMERKRPGVVVDTMGIRGMRATVLLKWNEALWRQQIRHRQPNLVILAYGTNESGDTRQPISRYRERLDRVLARVKKAVPGASCVIVGPTDRPIKTEGGYVDRPRVALIIEAQKNAAKKVGFAFWDARKAMGGINSMVKWVNSTPRLGGKDHVHLTGRGYRVLAEDFSNALMAGYRRR